MEFNTKISLGNIIQLVVLLSAIIFGWSQMVTRKELKEFESNYVRGDVFSLQLGIIDTKVQSVNSKVDEIKADVKDIKRAVRQ